MKITDSNVIVVVKRLAFIVFFTILICGIFYFVFDIDMQRCEMTYMFEYPEYKQYKIPGIKNNASFKHYRLFHYSEGKTFNELQGVPVLFIPGNSGSFKQVRSLASVSRQISLRNPSYSHQMFDYFSLDLNEELTAISSDLIKNQIEFASLAIQFISKLYDNKKELVLVGHSIGGIVARASAIKLEIQVLGIIKVVICLASPLENPVVGIDTGLVKLYTNINLKWLEQQKSIAVISITGGNRDGLVWDGYGRLHEATDHALWIPTPSVRDVWASTDHLCILWCRQLIVSINKALYKCLDSSGRISRGPKDIISVFKSRLFTRLNTGCLNSMESRIDFSFIRLLWQSQQIELVGDENSCVLIHALTHVTRPLRLQISNIHCSDEVTEANLVLDYLNHSHRYYIQNNQSVLLAIPASVQNGSIPLIHINRSPHCRQVVSVRASLIDWVAYLIRIHFGRVPSLVAATLVLRLLSAGPITWLAFVLSSTLGLLVGGHSTDIGHLYHLGLIDTADLLLLGGLSVPLAHVFSTVFAVCIHGLALVLGLGPPMQFRSVLLVFICLIFPPVLIITTTTDNAGALATGSLLFFYLVSVASSRRQKVSPDYSRQPWIASILLIICIFQASPLISSIHSQMKHGPAMSILQKWILGLRTFSNYGFSLSFLFLLMTIMFTVSRENIYNGKISQANAMLQFVNSVILASGCVIYASVDVCQCIPFLISALITSETVHYTRL